MTDHAEARPRKGTRRRLLLVLVGLAVTFALSVVTVFIWRYAHEFLPCDVQDHRNEQIIALAWAEISPTALNEEYGVGACDEDPMVYSPAEMPRGAGEQLVQSFVDAGWKVVEDVYEYDETDPEDITVLRKTVRQRPLEADIFTFDEKVAVDIFVRGFGY